MTLYILNPGISPLGDFDLLDTDAASIDGGEIMTLDKTAYVADSSTEVSAYDAKDGYLAPGVDAGTATQYRVVARIADETSETYKLFYLADDGTAGYGVIFGTVTGGVAGKTVGSNLGPNTVTGSGKITLWDKPGLYAVTRSMVVLGTTHGSNDTPTPGETLYRGTDGLLTVTGSTTATSDKVAVFVELTNNGSLVTTSGFMLGAAALTAYDRAKIHYLGATFGA